MDPALKEKLEKFLHHKDVLKELRKLAATGQKSLLVEFERLLEFDVELAKALLEDPTSFLEAADAALTEITKSPGIHFRVSGLPSDRTVSIRKIRAEHVGKFIQVGGILTRASEVRPEIRVAVFECLRCGEQIKRPQIGEFYQEPWICPNPNCGKRGRFRLVVEDSEFCDWQSLRIQERPEELRGGRMPHQLDAIVKDDFVDVAVAGNHVVVTGILHAFQEGLGRRQRRTFRKVLFVNHVEVLHKGAEEAELTPEDEARIMELAKDPRISNMIIQSIAPSIHGHEHVKEAIALQLFGCDAVELPDGTRIRGDSHTLLTGDPSTAKSQLLKWVALAAPRGLYTSGMKATGPGLTASAVRDELTGGWALEAGALVIADGGLTSIDEFEKMSDEDASAILEAMEQQTISVAKAGIVATLNARTAIFAAANPKLGRFDPYRPVPEQIALSPVILSRFDLAFVMRDEPHEEKDKDLARHMLQLHQKPEAVVKSPFDVDTLRKIIIYARKNIHPKFEGDELLKVIQDFYVNWRAAAQREAEPLPVTPRQLEALVRLAKAYARMRLSDKVTVEDAKAAIRLVKTSIEMASYDYVKGVRKVDIDVLMTGRPRSQRERIQRLMDIVKELEEKFEGVAPLGEIARLAGEEGMSPDFVDFVISQEVERGHLYKPTPDVVKRVVRA